MKAWGLLAGVVAAALLMAALALRPPSHRPASAPPAAFSAARALIDVRAVAQAPHPQGSPQLDKVQTYVLARMIQLRLAPVERPFGEGKAAGRNLVGVLPGLDRTEPAVLLMAHTDSVPAGPGAADDGAGVAAVLETVRALGMTRHRRDVMVLFTDGEETGLYGAKAFFTSDPLRAHVGTVINLEARGDQGRAVMFETHRGGGAMIGFLIAHGALKGASSLMPDVYRRLPNATDLTSALAQGYGGINFALFAGWDAYHRPLDTPDRLDPGSLQSLGGQVLAAARALADAPALPGRAPDHVYADVLGGPVLQYPAMAGWLLIGLAVVAISAAAWRALATGRTSLRGIVAACFAFLGLVLALGLALYGDGLARAQLAHRHLAPFLAHSGEALGGMALLAAGVLALWLWAAQKALRPDGLVLGALKVVAVFAILLQLLAPLDAFMLAWPLLLACAAALLWAWRPDLPWAVAVIAAAGLAQLLYWGALFFAIQGQVVPVVLAPFAALAALMLLPVVPITGRWTAVGGVVVAGLGLALSLAAMRP
jgi:hypothetical protein